MIGNEAACNRAIQEHGKRSSRHIAGTWNLFTVSRKIYGADLRRE